MENVIKKCLICGDRALGNNFDVLSCPSCKAFFRRNAIRKKEYSCLFNNNCHIDKQTRKYCKKCRLKKCYAMGMKKDWILLNEWKKENKRKSISDENTENTDSLNKIIKNFNNHNNNHNFNNVVNDTVNSIHNNHNNYSFNDNNDNNKSDKQESDNDNTDTDIIFDDIINDNNITPEIPSPIEITDLFDDISVDMDIMADIESQIQEIADQVVTTNNELNGTVGRQPLLLLPPQELSSLAASVAVIPTVERPILPNYRNTFNELEGLKLQELIRAANIFRDVPRVSQTQTIVFGYRPPNLFERHMRRLTKMCQQLTAFSSICQTDAIALVKYGCVDLFCMRSVPNYNCTDDNWTFALDNQDSIIINMKAIKNFPSNVYHFSRKFYHQICREWDTDLVILDLLTAIILFNPDRPNLLHKHMIKYHQHLYLYLLQRYLLLKYRTESAAQLKFRRLMNCLVDFKVLSDYGGDQSAGHLCRRRSNSTIATTVTTEAAAPVPSAEGCAINMDNDKSTENTTQTIQFRPSLSLYTIILSQVFESMTINDN